MNSAAVGTGAMTAIAGAATVLVVWMVQTMGHITVPAEISSALTTLIGAGAAYIGHATAGPPGTKP